MGHAITRNEVVDAAAGYFLPELLSCEDLDRFEETVRTGGREILSAATARCVESFDQLVRQHIPRSWSVHEVKRRTVLTLFGEVAYRRTVFLDEFGRRRTPTDELLGIPKRARLSAGAFLWLVRRASEESYRKTARAFRGLSGCALSHVTVMNCVRAEGALLKGRPAPAGPKISQDALFVEVDGLWVHTQVEAHRDGALPRFLYEQARRTTSFELKLAAVYAGKKKVAPGRYERGGLILTCRDGSPDDFWKAVYDTIDAEYEVDDLERIWLGADGGSWCGPERIGEKLPESTVLSCSLDPFHIMQKICRAFPEGPGRDWAVNLAVRRKAGQLARMCERSAPRVADARRRERMRDLEAYMVNNAGAVTFPRPSMGTMEGTNAHVGAARLKGQGRSWSRAGAEAMCLVRCALATGRPLIAPRKDAVFSGKEQEAASSRGLRSAGESPAIAGSGYLPPHMASTGAMKTNVGFRARTC
jgi:hypothetical protein